VLILKIRIISYLCHDKEEQENWKFSSKKDKFSSDFFLEIYRGKKRCLSGASVFCDAPLKYSVLPWSTDVVEAPALLRIDLEITSHSISGSSAVSAATGGARIGVRRTARTPSKAPPTADKRQTPGKPPGVSDVIAR
jgi:hypothetical protein